MYAMTEFAMARLVPSKKLRDNISIDIHLRKHLNAGEAKLSEHANRYRPRAVQNPVDRYPSGVIIIPA